MNMLRCNMVNVMKCLMIGSALLINNVCSAFTVTNNNKYAIEFYFDIANSYLTEYTANLLDVPSDKFAEDMINHRLSKTHIKFMREIYNQEYKKSNRCDGIYRRYKINELGLGRGLYESACNPFNHILIEPGETVTFETNSSIKNFSVLFGSEYFLAWPFTPKQRELKEVSINNSPLCHMTIFDNGYFNGVRAELNYYCQ